MTSFICMCIPVQERLQYFVSKAAFHHSASVMSLSRSLITVVLVACAGQLPHYIPHQICINRSFVSD